MFPSRVQPLRITSLHCCDVCKLCFVKQWLCFENEKFVLAFIILLGFLGDCQKAKVITYNYVSIFSQLHSYDDAIWIKISVGERQGPAEYWLSFSTLMVTEAQSFNGKNWCRHIDFNWIFVSRRFFSIYFPHLNVFNFPKVHYIDSSTT